MKNMIRRRKKKSKRKQCGLDICDPHHVLNSHSSYLNMSDSMSTEMMCQLYEGQLYKYTNVMKGWQFRWFILDPKTGILNYYLSESESRQTPRGWVHLESAVISPSDEDSNTFTVNSSSGEMFKLRAQDARARQEWVNRLRAVAELHAMAVAHNNPPLLPREHVTPGNGGLQSSSTLAVWDAFSAVKDHLFRAEQSNFLLARAIDDLPTCGDVRHVDNDLLLLKAASHAMLLSLSQCLYILQHQQSTASDIGSCKSSKANSDNPNCSSSHSKKKFVL
ncbi:oxysterol-binding protein-related protein 11 isoform X2 [Homalodisca vitripennis]|uniref:oxysterol-binding protein-related protein 11 isoform X2 n=1 Tax=Homalodisca vitripennis TaxID=197043 RepID=UPI001EEC7B53|nr:oxysterol-binding protein-related protein 11 isoform X2 [Homalodisca vitripennis]